jgi:hypothetical protein
MTMDKAVEQAPRPEPDIAERTPPPPLPGWIVSTARWTSFHLAATVRRVWARRGAPCVIFGVALMGTALVVAPNSTWTLPIFGIGAVLIAIGLLGPRLRIILGMRWQPEGLAINFNLGVDARTDRPLGETTGAGVEGGSAESLPASGNQPGPPSVAEEIEVLEGVAETMEFSAAEVERQLAKSKAAEQDPGAPS